MEKEEYEEYDWEENIEFDVSDYYIIARDDNGNGDEYIWEYEADDDEEIESLENTIEENGGVYEGYISDENYYEKIFT